MLRSLPKVPITMVDVPVLSRFGKRTMKSLNCKFNWKYAWIVYCFKVFEKIMSDWFCISSQENACGTSRTSSLFYWSTNTFPRARRFQPTGPTWPSKTFHG